MNLVKCVVLMMLLLGTTSLAQVNQLAETDRNKPLIINPDATSFTIHLKSNPSTGFGWHLKDYQPWIITPVSESYQPSSQNKPGAGGIDSFVFQIKDNAFAIKRVSTITFVYIRPWSLEVGDTATFNLVSLKTN